uniref:DUF4194 domain-containing protein n=1 Tax=Caenorhabditis tropicalis TaxID=1561998 RepID=A0A1I7TPG0_9PELO
MVPIRIYRVELEKMLLVGGGASHVANVRYDYSNIVISLRQVARSDKEENRFFYRTSLAIDALLDDLVWNHTTLGHGGSTSNQIFDKKGVLAKNSGNVELKFVLWMARDYEFATDSLKIDVVPRVQATSDKVMMENSDWKTGQQRKREALTKKTDYRIRRRFIQLLEAYCLFERDELREAIRSYSNDGEAVQK